MHLSISIIQILYKYYTNIKKYYTNIIQLLYKFYTNIKKY